MKVSTQEGYSLSLVKSLTGSLKILKDLAKIFKDKDPYRIPDGSLKELQRSSPLGS